MLDPFDNPIKFNIIKKKIKDTLHETIISPDFQICPQALEVL